MLFIAKHRKQLLFSIAESTAVGYHPASQYFVFITDGKLEAHANRLSGNKAEFLFLCTDYFLRHRIEKNQSYCSGLRLTSHIRDRSCKRSLISHTYKAGKIRSQHKFLTRGSFTVQCSHQHPFRMRISTEVPTCQTFGHRERERDFSLFIGTKLRIEEGCFCKIRTQVGRSFRECFVSGRFIKFTKCSRLAPSRLKFHIFRSFGD